MSSKHIKTWIPHLIHHCRVFEVAIPLKIYDSNIQWLMDLAFWSFFINPKPLPPTSIPSANQTRTKFSKADLAVPVEVQLAKKVPGKTSWTMHRRCGMSSSSSSPSPSPSSSSSSSPVTSINTNHIIRQPRNTKQKTLITGRFKHGTSHHLKFIWQRRMSSRKPWSHLSCTRGCCLKSRKESWQWEKTGYGTCRSICLDDTSANHFSTLVLSIFATASRPSHKIRPS